jgi:hypothetical protein
MNDTEVTSLDPVAISAKEIFNEISGRVYRAQAIVEKTAVAVEAEEPPEGLSVKYTLEAASTLLLKLASDIAYLADRIRWVSGEEEERQ